jgi:hypothetical protein
MKKKISFILLGVGVLATPCFAMFGEDALSRICFRSLARVDK